MIEFLLITVQVIALYLLADLMGGVFHWAEDTLGDSDDFFWGKVFVQPNEVHHNKPAEMIRIPWYINNIPILTVTGAVLGTAWVMDAISWQLVVFAAFGGANQQVHRFAHGNRLRLPGFIKWFQKIGLIQNARHHWIHHTAPHTTNYCVLTPWMNPVLNATGFWRVLERIFVPVFGAPRRPDLKSRSWYRG